MSVVVATAYMEEAERFDWLAAMDAGRVARRREARANSGRAPAAASLEEAFIALLPEERRRGDKALVIPPRARGRRRAWHRGARTDLPIR